jgi:hypothetical protein
MQWRLLMTVAVAVSGAACSTTTTVGSVSSAGSARRLVEIASSDGSLETADSGVDEPSVVVQATSPTDVQFRTRNDVGAPIALLPRRRAVNRGAIVRQGMMVGVVIGAVTGLVQGSARDRSERENLGASCDPYCGGHALVDTPIVALLGLGLGAAAGAIVAHFANQ